LDGKGWTFVKDLKVGDLLVSSDGTKLAIDKIEKESREATVYNFEVEDFNSYFVSNLGIWVHNCAVKVTGDGGPNFSPNFDKKLRKHARDIYETSRDLGVPVKKGDKEWMEEFILSIVNEPQNLANSKPFKWNTIESVDAFVMGDAVVLVNRDANEILTFLNKKGNRLSSMLISELDLIRE
ncbi:polymorphic toxin-type HINT domain-containing protein, partial [Paenibacillus algorifonticola]